jgi:hypothetical protein
MSDERRGWTGDDRLLHVDRDSERGHRFYRLVERPRMPHTARVPSYGSTLA